MTTADSTTDLNDPASYFLNLARRTCPPPSNSPSISIAGATTAKMMDEDQEDEPKELNTTNIAGGFIAVSTDKLSVKYTGTGLHDHDVGAVQADKPVPSKRMVYYFEIYVRNAGVKGRIGIGFTDDCFKMCRQPGWEENSCGYHGDDGVLFRGQGVGESCGPTYTTADKVGAGINYASKEIFFTKSGAIVGAIDKDLKGPLFPTVGLHSQDEEIEVNFGKKPFAFELKEYEAQQRMKLQKAVDEIPLPPDVSFGLVRSYLLHYGYGETLNSLDLATKSTVTPVSTSQFNGFNGDGTAYKLDQRKILRQLIRKGQIDTALSKLQDWYPQIVQDEKSATCFLLHCQRFIELVRVGDLIGAVKYGRIRLGMFFELPVYSDLVQDCVALLAYEHPQSSSVGYLLQDSQREIVADAVNAMILLTYPDSKDLQSCLHSYLEKLLRQLPVCCLERRSLNGDEGETFNLHKVLNSTGKPKF